MNKFNNQLIYIHFYIDEDSCHQLCYNSTIVKHRRTKASLIMASQLDQEIASTPITPVTHKAKGLLRATTLVAAMTSISRVLGFVRDLVVAHIFGATAAVDAFLVAFKIPNFLRRLFAEGAFAQAFVPVLAQFRHQNHEQDTIKMVRQVATALSSVLFLVTVVGVLLAPVLVMIFAPGFLENHYKFELSSTMLRITFPYLFLISMTAFAGSILNSFDRFGVAAFTPVLLNVAMIMCSFWLRDYFSEPTLALACGVTLGGILQLLFQIPFLRQIKLTILPDFAQISHVFKEESVQRILKLMLPALFGVSVAQINLLIDTLFASFLQNGSVSWLYFSDRILEFPLGIFGIAMATVTLPKLSRHFATKAQDAYNQTLDWGMRSMLFISTPCMVGLVFLAQPILITLFQYGEFTAHDMTMTSRSLIAFSLGLPAFMIIKVLASAFYSRQNVRTPVRIGVIAMLTNTLLNTLLIWQLAHAGLALATTLAAFLNAGLLYYTLRQKDYFQPQKHWRKYLLQLFAANGLLAITLYYFSSESTQWLNWLWYERALHLAYLIAMGAAVYFGSLWLLGFNWRALKQH